VERGDVLERNEDVAVQLEVRDLVHEAVRREHAFLVVTPEEGDLDALALVLAGVVLHRGSVYPAE
jgi:dynactin complex subunit